MATKVTSYVCDDCGDEYYTLIDAERCCMRPELLEKPDVEGLQIFLATVIREIAVSGYYKDFEYEVAHKTLKAFYGNSVATWLNKNWNG